MPYVRLVKSDVDWQDRIHFFSLASRMMRRILVDHAKANRADKRGGDSDPLPLNEEVAGKTDRDWDLVDLDLALEKLGEFEPRQVRALELRFFAGLTNEEVAKALDISVTTARTDMRFARAWLKHRRPLQDHREDRRRRGSPSGRRPGLRGPYGVGSAAERREAVTERPWLFPQDLLGFTSLH